MASIPEIGDHRRVAFDGVREAAAAARRGVGGEIEQARPSIALPRNCGMYLPGMIVERQLAERLRVGGERGGEGLADGADLEQRVLRHGLVAAFRGNAVGEDMAACHRPSPPRPCPGMSCSFRSGANARSTAAAIFAESAACDGRGDEKEERARASGLSAVVRSVNSNSSLPFGVALPAVYASLRRAKLRRSSNGYGPEVTPWDVAHYAERSRMQ